jgi:hypothetical protein
MMMFHNFFKKILYLPIVALIFWGVQDFCHKKTQGFSLTKAKSYHAPSEKKTLSLPRNSPLLTILRQPFYFLQKGLQCYVFVSEDNKYVLKLFRWKELEPSGFSRILPRSWIQDTVLKKQKKKELDFASYQIAWDSLKEETGLVFLHLDKTQGLDLSLCLYDPILVRHIIPADDIEFIVQKKVDPFLPYFEKNQKCPENLYPFFSQLALLLKSRVQKGISDSDISLQYNMGICEGLPVLFDIGNLTKIEMQTQSHQKQLEYEARLVLQWLAEKKPELEIFFRQSLYSEEFPCETPLK